MKRLISITTLTSSAMADVRDPYKATLDVLHGTGQRATLKAQCHNDARYEYVVQNADAIASITIGDDSMQLELVGGGHVNIAHTFGGRGFVPMGPLAKLYVFADAARELVHVGIIVRSDTTPNATVCAEKWVGKGKRR